MSGADGGSRPARRRRRRGERGQATPEGPDAAGPPAALAELLSSYTSGRGWERRIEGARVHERWEEIAGEQLAESVTPVRLHGGVLVLRVASPAWATQVRYLAAEITSRANEVLGPGQVRRVVVVTGREEAPRQGPPGR